MARLGERKFAGEAQKFIAIREIRGNALVLKSHDLRAILLVSSVNFALKSADEQEALVYQFQNFLNGVDFPLQIVIQSRKTNIEGYLAMLEERRREEDNELLIIQTQEYIEFIKGFIQIANIMTKMFYVVIPFSVAEKRGGVLQKLKQLAKPVKVSQLSEERFRQYSSQLLQRARNVMANLASIGLKSKLLEEEELVELLRSTYNPGGNRTGTAADETHVPVS